MKPPEPAAVAAPRWAQRLKGLMAARVVTVTTLLLLAVYVESISETLPRTNPLYTLIAATYVLTLVYVLASRFLPPGEWQVQAQLLGDVGVVTGIVYVTAGAATPGGFTLLYPVVVLSGGALLSLRRGLALAVAATLLYGALLAFVVAGWLPPRGLHELPELPPLRLFNSVLVVGVSCGAAGLIGGYLSESLRTAGRQLEHAAGEVADLRELNAQIVDSIQSGLLTADESTRVAHVNDFGARILGLDRAQLRGRLLREVLATPLLAPAAVAVRAAGRGLTRFEIDYAHPDGDPRHLGLSVSALRRSQRAAEGFLLVFQDLTDIKRLEREVRVKEKLAAAGQLSAALAHEIRNPLGSISGSAEVLLTGSVAPEDQQRLLEIIKRESRRLSSTLQRFLVHARPPPPLTPVDVGPLVAEAVALLRNGSEVLPVHRIEYSAEAVSLVCLADADQIVQVFWNLARNGLEAMPAGGLLSIALHARAGEAVLSVRDEGTGMGRDDQARMFEPFYSKNPMGVGLGLAIVYRIVRQHQGDIHVRSAPGRGTEVEVRLPLVRVPAPA